MGSPLAPILANLFMGYNENDSVEKAQVSKPTFYKKYADDIFEDSNVWIRCINISYIFKYQAQKHQIYIWKTNWK